MILNDKEKRCIVDNLSWMIKSMGYNHDQLKGNLEEGSQGDYSSELKEAMSLLEDVKEVETLETIGYHRRALSVNCRCFICMFNKQGVCKLSKITLESTGSLLVGQLKCVQSEVKSEEEKNQKCLLCNNTGKPCDSCREYHDKDTMCPSHEVRMKWVKKVCPVCGKESKCSKENKD